MTSDSPRVFSNGPKKYPASLNANNGRSLHTRQRLLSTKISAPLPINLPSLKSESGTDGPSAHSWGNSASPEITHVQPVELPTTRAWALPTHTRVEPAVTQKEKPDEDIKEMHEATRISWDEMVDDEQDEFSVDVIEFEDGAKFPLNEVTPSERFVDDYDRSYRPRHEEAVKREPVQEESAKRETRAVHEEARREEELARPRYEERMQASWATEEHRRPLEKTWHDERRRSQDRRHEERVYGWDERHRSQERYHEPRRVSGEKPWGMSSVQKVEHVSVLQKGPHIAAAAERAQRRHEEQEAQYEAARERARQKAEKLKAEHHPGSLSAHFVRAQEPDAGWPYQTRTLRKREEQAQAPQHIPRPPMQPAQIPPQPVTPLNRVPSEVLWWGEDISHDTRPNPGLKDSLPNWTLDLPPVTLRPEPPTISILQHERTKKEPVNYRDKIEAMLRNHASPVFSQAVHKTIAEKPKHLNFMFKNTTKPERPKRLPTLLYRFPANKNSQNHGVVLLPTPVAMDLDRKNLPRPFPLPRQMILK